MKLNINDVNAILSMTSDSIALSMQKNNISRIWSKQ